MANKKNIVNKKNSIAEENGSIIESLVLLDLLNNEQIDKVGGTFSTYNFGLSGYKKLVEQAGLTDLSFAQVSELVIFLRYFQDHLGVIVRDKKNFKTAFIEFLGFHDVDAEEAKELGERFYNKLWVIYNSKLESRDWHQNGLIDVLLDFDGFIDIRPMFFESKVVDLLPVVIFRAALQKDYENPRNVVFQLSADEFAELRNKIEDVRQRLDGIEKKLKNKEVLNLFAE